jgi:hypothetical protein
LKPHYYSERPSNIIWIQLAGFTDQQIPLLRFENPDANFHTQFETADCLGKIWAYNLYDLRPKAATSFLSQITGSKNMKGTCEDFSRKPVWNYLESEGYKTAILENGANAEESLEKYFSCGEVQKNFFKSSYFVRMGPESRAGVERFHYQDSPTNLPGLYYDKSCQKGLCFTSLFNNAKKILENVSTPGNRSFYLIRDFSYLKALRIKDLNHAREILQDLDKFIAWIQLQKSSDTLVVVTGAEGLEVDFPKEGKEWAEFERLGKNLNLRNTTLENSVFAKGPMAENFCGLFDEAEISKRMLYKPEGKKFSWDALNPLSN